MLLCLIEKRITRNLQPGDLAIFGGAEMPVRYADSRPLSSPPVFDNDTELCHTYVTTAELKRRLFDMSMDLHLEELERRREALKKEIEDELAHPGFDDLYVAELKRRKLQLKDEIARLKRETEAGAPSH